MVHETNHRIRYPNKASGSGSIAGQRDPEGGAVKKIVSPERRREAVEQAQRMFTVSERRICRALGQPRSIQRYNKQTPEDEAQLTTDIVALASQYVRYGYRRVFAMLQRDGWQVNHKRVERIWRLEGLKVPRKQPNRGRLWLNDSSVIRLRPELPNHIWSYDFVEDRTHNGVQFRILNVIDEYTRECLAVRVKRTLTHKDVLEVLAVLFWKQGVPVHIPSDNGAEFTAGRVRAWLARLAVTPLFIEPGSPWENGYVESFNGKMPDELLTREIFYSLKEAQVMVEVWRPEYNTVRPHSSLGYRSPAPAAITLQPSHLQPLELSS